MLLEPLAELQKALVLQSPVIWTDDTPVTVLGGERARQHHGPVLGLHRRRRAPLHRLRLHDEPQPRRPGGVPARTTAASSRPMPTAATTGSSSAPTAAIVEVACWAHARRKFYDARSNAPREANEILEWIRQLYDIEDRARDLTAGGASGAAAAGVGADPRSDRGEAG